MVFFFAAHGAFDFIRLEFRCRDAHSNNILQKLLNRFVFFFSPRKSRNEKEHFAVVCVVCFPLRAQEVALCLHVIIFRASHLVFKPQIYLAPESKTVKQPLL